VLLLWRIAAVGQSVSDDEHSGRRLIDHGPNSLLLAEIHGEVVGSLTGWAAAGYAAELEWVRGVRMLWRRRLSRRSGGGQRNARGTLGWSTTSRCRAYQGSVVARETWTGMRCVGISTEARLRSRIVCMPSRRVAHVHSTAAQTAREGPHV
jgi:hypothetical protein